MDYKKKLIELIGKVENETLLERLYVFANKFIKSWGN
nr:MAG TPA: hypothetical protein [Caudoviricetes sp.]